MAGVAAGAPEPEAGRFARGVVLISLDTLRADGLGCYGEPGAYSPFLDRWSLGVVQVRDAIVQAPWTLASHMSLFTSQYPNVHNVNMAEARLAEEKRTLAEVLRDRGWQTKGIHANPFLSGRFGFDQGFESYEFVGIEHGEQSARAVARWLRRRDPERPFFLFLHFNDPHVPYEAPSPYRGVLQGEYDGPISGSLEDVRRYKVRPLDPRDLEQLRRVYREEAYYLDSQIARVFGLLADAGLYEASLIVVTADHGEEFKEHGRLEHQNTLHEELLRAPLLIKPPGEGRGRGRLLATPVKSIDLFPTILELSGEPVPAEGVQGRSLASLIRGGAEVGLADEPILSESVNTLFVSARTRRWKYIYERTTGKEQLYDLERDPGERRNLAAERPDVVGRFAPLVQRYIEQSQAGWHVRTRAPWSLRGVFRTDGRFQEVESFALESGDVLRVAPDGREITVNFEHGGATDRYDGIDFTLSPPTARLELELLPAREGEQLEASGVLSQVFLGRDYRNPKGHPILLAGEGAGADCTVGVGDAIIFTADPRGTRPGLFIWHVPEASVTREAAEIDAETRQQLESLGYLQ
jgi:arylsulfatase A-like enzyme